MFDGKILRVATGTPMRRMERANNSFADAEPEPFTLANLTTKSLVALIGLDMAAGLGGIEEEFLHIPGAGRAAFGAQSTMQAKVFVLGHDASGLQRLGDIEILRIGMGGRRGQPPAQLGFRAVLREGDAVHRTDIDASIALDAFGPFEDGLHVAVQATLGFHERLLDVETELDLDFDILQG